MLASLPASQSVSQSVSQCQPSHFSSIFQQAVATFADRKSQRGALWKLCQLNSFHFALFDLALHPPFPLLPLLLWLNPIPPSLAVFETGRVFRFSRCLCLIYAHNYSHAHFTRLPWPCAASLLPPHCLSLCALNMHFKNGAQSIFHWTFVKRGFH